MFDYFFATILQNNITKLYLRNVIQTYIQSTLNFTWNFFTYFHPKLIIIIKVLFNYILKVLKFLYGILEVGNYWFTIYYNYDINNISMIE